MVNIISQDNKIYIKALSKFNSKFKNIENNSDIKAKDIISFIICLMQIVEKYKINGASKKDIVIRIINDILENNKNSIENVEFIQSFVKNILPSFIDTIISLDKKEIIIKLENTLTKCGCL